MKSFRIELDTRLLHFAIRQKPDERFIVKINNLDAVAPRVAKIAAEGRLEFQFIFLREFLSNLLQLRFIANHDSEVPHVGTLHLLNFENREELMLTQFEERIALAATHLFEIEHILVKRYCLSNVVHLDRDMIASIDLHAHMKGYAKTGSR